MPEAELYAAALGALEAKGVESMMSDLGFVVKPVLIIDAKVKELILHRHGIDKMKHIDVTYLRLQDEVKSNRLRVRRVKSEDTLADIGTKALSNRIIRKHSISVEYLDVQENLRSGDVMALWVDESEQEIRADQHSRKRHWSHLVAMPHSSISSSSSGSEGSRISLRVVKRDDSKPDVSPSCGPFPRKRIVTVSFSPSYVDFLKILFCGQHEVLGR